jgi:MFS family permease
MAQHLAPWYLAYLILGLIHGGMLPFLLPLAMARAGHDLDSVAFVIGAYYVGLLPAPLLGTLAERRRLFRPVFFGGFIAVSVGLAALPEVSRLGIWAPLVLLAGIGVGATATVAPLFVVDFAPKSDWEPRIGWLQSFYGGGQLAGLLVAGIIARGPLSYGFWLAAALAIVAALVGHIGLPSDDRRQQLCLPPLAWGKLMRGFEPGAPPSGLLQQSHHLHRAALGSVASPLGGGFVRFLSAWALVNLGVAPFFAYYPLLMKENYGIGPTSTAFLYALAAAIGIGLFGLAGRAAKQKGPRLVFQAGLALRMAGFGILGVLTLTPLPGKFAFAILAFTLVMLAWPVLSVSGTGLAARLTPISEGAAMGLLAASNALATVFGTFLGGPLVEAFGYKIVPLIAVACLAGAEILMGRWEPTP